MNLLKKGLLALLAGAITMNIQAGSAPGASHTSGAALRAGATTIFNIFELGIQPGKTADYDRVGEHNITTSVGHEPGTLAMYSVKQKANPNMAYMVEVYADQSASEAHRASEPYKAFLKASPTLLTDHKKPYRLTPQFLGDRRVKQTPKTRTNFVSVTVKPGQNDAFRAVVMPEMAQSMKVEPGVLAIYAATAQNNPSQWYFFEVYADEAAYQAHRQSPHFQDYLKRTSELLQDKSFTDITPTLLMNKGGLAFSAP